MLDINILEIGQRVQLANGEMFIIVPSKDVHLYPELYNKLIGVSSEDWTTLWHKDSEYEVVGVFESPDVNNDWFDVTKYGKQVWSKSPLHGKICKLTKELEELRKQIAKDKGEI